MKKTAMDWYLRVPIIIDIILSFALCYLIVALLGDCSVSEDKQNNLNVISSIISTCVSLAGFILAALTIIVTFKSNLKSKGVAEADDALELILSSKHYDSIVSVFKVAIIEFILIAFSLYFISALSLDFTNSMLTMVTFMAISLTGLCIWRSLFILFRILRMEKKNIDKKRN